MTRDRRLLLDAGVAGGVAAWKVSQLAAGGLAGLGPVLVTVEFVAASAVFVLLASNMARGGVTRDDGRRDLSGDHERESPGQGPTATRPAHH
jgi:hypothetical protein